MPEAPRALSVRRFAAMLFRAAPRATVVSIVLMVLVALTEGIGLLMLVPLLALAGVTTGVAAPQSGLLGHLTARLPHSLGLLLLVYVVVVAARAALEFAETVAAVTCRRRSRDRCASGCIAPSSGRAGRLSPHCAAHASRT